MKRVFLALLVLSLLAASSLPAQTPRIYSGEKAVLRTNIPSFVGYVPDEIVVKFKSSYIPDPTRPVLQAGSTGIVSVDRLGGKYGVVKLEQLFRGARPKLMNGKVYNLAGWYRIKFTSKADVQSVVAEYKNLPEIEDAQPIGIHTVLATPNDGNYSSQWHLNQASDHDLDAPEAWDIETGNSSIIVAMLDTGVRYFHKDLGGADASYDHPENANGNMWINWAEKNGTAGVDDDGNGFVDDWIGWDFVDGATQGWSGEDVNTQDNDPRDFNGHGTHCAGNIAAINNNGYATCSSSGGWGNGSLQATANGVKVMACRVGWSGRYYIWEVGYVRMDYAAQAFYYAADNGAKIASCSWGSDNSGGLGDAVDYFLAHGGLIFKAAGNDGNTTADYMCGRSDVISVAATDQNDCKADFSNYGSWVDISAPGVGIYSLYHDHTDPQSDYVASMDGTSMATPIAASVAALIWSHNTSWSASQVEQRLYDTADDIYSLSCNSSYNGKLGAGRVNAYNAVYGGGPQPPVADFSGSPTSGCAALTVNFSDESTGDIDSWSWDFGDGGTSTAQNPSHTYSNAGTYTVKLTATNAYGSDTNTKTDYITVTAPAGNEIGEVGKIVRNQTGNGDDWYSVTMNRSYSAPVVVMKALSYNGGDPTHLRVRNVTSNTFEWKMEEWDYKDGNHTTETCPYIIVNAGVYTLEDGTKIEAGTFTASTSFKTVTFPEAFSSAPTLLVGVMSDNDDAAVVARTRNLSSSSFQVKLQEEEAADKVHSNETIAWVAIERTTGTNNGNQFIASTTGNSVKNSWYTINFSPAFSAEPIFLCHDDTYDGGNTCDVRFNNLSATSVDVKIEEEKSKDSEVNHITEEVSYLAWAAAGDIIGTSATSTASNDKLPISPVIDATRNNLVSNGPVKVFELGQNYPNPFNPVTVIRFSLAKAGYTRLEVFNVAGQRIAKLVDGELSAGSHEVTWNARGATSGVYFYRLTSGDKRITKRMILLR